MTDRQPVFWEDGHDSGIEQPEFWLKLQQLGFVSGPWSLASSEERAKAQELSDWILEELAFLRQYQAEYTRAKSKALGVDLKIVKKSDVTP